MATESVSISPINGSSVELEEPHAHTLSHQWGGRSWEGMAAVGQQLWRSGHVFLPHLLALF